ncbi:MAG: arginase family protein [Bacteriovoracaceae bacterium]|jgi:formiminoglutamase|nr:arginase family protein [Bacteriovoracaceae bacterium]
MKPTNRKDDYISTLYTTKNNQSKYSILLSPSDIGVRLNQGRNGTRFAPEALLNTFGKLNKYDLDIESIKVHQVSNQQDERIDFEKSQIKETLLIEKNLAEHKTIHIGGGHDHVYPLIKAISRDKAVETIHIINIDAHLDTRVDTFRHSGTPFRDADQINTKKINLYQFGIHRYANSELTRTELCHINMQVCSDLSFLKDIKPGQKDVLIISLDADALDSSVMEAVSAVNHDGVSKSEISSIMNYCLNLNCKKVFGIYEYNPVFDNLSQKGARYLASLIYKFITND